MPVKHGALCSCFDVVHELRSGIVGSQELFHVRRSLCSQSPDRACSAQNIPPRWRAARSALQALKEATSESAERLVIYADLKPCLFGRVSPKLPSSEQEVAMETCTVLFPFAIKLPCTFSKQVPKTERASSRNRINGSRRQGWRPTQQVRRAAQAPLARFPTE